MRVSARGLAPSPPPPDLMVPDLRQDGLFVIYPAPSFSQVVPFPRQYCEAHESRRYTLPTSRLYVSLGATSGMSLRLQEHSEIEEKQGSLALWLAFSPLCCVLWGIQGCCQKKPTISPSVFLIPSHPSAVWKGRNQAPAPLQSLQTLA